MHPRRTRRHRTRRLRRRPHHHRADPVRRPRTPTPPRLPRPDVRPRRPRHPRPRRPDVGRPGRGLPPPPGHRQPAPRPRHHGPAHPHHELRGPPRPARRPRTPPHRRHPLGRRGPPPRLRRRDHPRVLGTEGQVLDVGRTSRLVTTGIWTALVLRDRHCAFPGCTRLPIACDAHHIIHWADGGATSLDNLILLCRKHHTLTHQTPWQVADRPKHQTTGLDPTTTHRRHRPVHLHTSPTTTTAGRLTPCQPTSSRHARPEIESS